jgi:hypothetical protein
MIAYGMKDTVISRVKATEETYHRIHGKYIEKENVEVCPV